MKWIYQDVKGYLAVCKCSNCGATTRVNDGGNLPCYCKNCGELEDLGFATDCKEPNRMTDKKDIIKELDGADVFLRNRANSKPAPLNEYDIEILLDGSNALSVNDVTNIISFVSFDANVSFTCTGVPSVYFSF